MRNRFLENRKMLQIYLSAATKQKIVELSKAQGQSVSGLIRKLILCEIEGRNDGKEELNAR